MNIAERILNRLRPLSAAVNVSAAILLGGAFFTSHGADSVGLRKFAEGFVSPTGFASIPGARSAFLVSDQVGVIYLLNGEGKPAEKPFLDLRPKMCKLNQDAFDERGLLGFAFHPEFAQVKKIYVTYSAPKRESAPADWDDTLTLSEFAVSSDGQSADISSERVLLQIDKPYFNHNGASLAFGPDNFLYMSVGDGGNANDIDNPAEKKGHTPNIGNGQDVNTLLAKILRIDVNKSGPQTAYAIPSDNPFVGKAGRPEIYAYGLRNVWRMSFDRAGSHELFGADVGQDLYEEVNIIAKGGNYGWFIREGFHCFDAKDPKHPPQDCPKVGANGEPLLDPIFEYKHTGGLTKDPNAKGISITGGYVYRGKTLPQLQGKYVFGDWSRVFFKADGVIFAASKSESGQPWKVEEITLASHQKGLNMYVVAFGQDADGEIYAMTNDSSALKGTTGKVWKLAPM
jgi:glucose/arabinose dehydrogenase